MEGLTKSLRGLVSALNPLNLEDAIEKALRLESTSARNKTPSNHKKPFHKKDKPRHNHLSKRERDELKEKGLCYTCKNPWKRGHTCEKKEDKRRKNPCRRCNDEWTPGHRCAKSGQAHKLEATTNEEAEDNTYKKEKYEGDEHGTLTTIT